MSKPLDIGILPKRSFNTAEAAHYLGVSTAFLEAGRRSKVSGSATAPPKHITIPGTGSRKMIRYLKEHLDTWLDEVASERTAK